MKYLTALIPLVMFFVIDLILVVSIFGWILISDNGGPYSYTFARRIWCP